MNELTIEQLKSLKVGDWVWVVSSYYNREGYYRRIEPAFSADEEILARFEGVDEIMCIRFEDYGTKWVAYKNKEQAEAKGEIIELPCIAMVEQGLVDGKLKQTKEAQQFNGRYAVVYIDKSKYKKPLIDICWSKYSHYDYAQAERRLAELTKE